MPDKTLSRTPTKTSDKANSSVMSAVLVQSHVLVHELEHRLVMKMWAISFSVKLKSTIRVLMTIVHGVPITACAWPCTRVSRTSYNRIGTALACPSLNYIGSTLCPYPYIVSDCKANQNYHDARHLDHQHGAGDRKALTHY